MEIAEVRSALAEHAALYSVLAELSLRDRRIMELRFGLDGQGVRPVADVARLFCLSKGRIHQIEDDVLTRMAKRVEALASSAIPTSGGPQRTGPETDAAQLVRSLGRG
jgi:DNA-directed RNA polymerase sigma subunit (sigma70/sigma32)